MFYAIAAMIQKIGFAIGASAPLIILGAVGYNSAGETAPEKLQVLTLCYSILPAVLVLIAAWLTMRYSLTAAQHRDIRSEIDVQFDRGGTKL